MASSYDDDDDVPDAVLARLIPRKANRWIFATIAAQFTEGVLEIAAEAMHDVSTILVQRFNWEQERVEMFESVGREIEALDEVEEGHGASTS